MGDGFEHDRVAEHRQPRLEPIAKGFPSLANITSVGDRSLEVGLTVILDVAIRLLEGRRGQMTNDDQTRSPNEQTRAVWDDNATLWDEGMGEGNDFVEVLIWPATERLLALQPGERVLDIACGNGLYSRRLAAA